jgi:hypothetical protein
VAVGTGSTPLRLKSSLKLILWLDFSFTKPSEESVFSMEFRVKRKVFCSVAVMAAVYLTRPTLGATYNLTPSSNWLGILGTTSVLGPGDEVILGEGVYSTSSRLSFGHVGTAALPIVIRAAEGADVTFTRPNALQNVINIEGAQYMTLQGVTVTGGSSGIRIGQAGGRQAKFITLDGNRIHGVGGVGVTANYSGNTYEGMHFLNNEIYNTGGEGEGFYLGGNNNSAQFFDGIIERNYIHNLNGPTVTQGDGIELKDGSYNNIVRDNVIHDTHYPGILVYGVEEQGGRNIIERNVIWNSGDHGIQAAADAIIRNNIIFSSAGDGIHSQNHQGAIPGNLTIENNTVRTNGNAIYISSPTGGAYSGPVEIANNALYPAGSFAINLPFQTNTNIAANIGTGFSTSGLASSQFNNSGNLLSDFQNFAALNAFPKMGSKLIGAGLAALQPGDDFNLSSRSGSADVGAYIYDANGNPGWPIGPSFKQFLESGQPGDFNGDDVVDGSDFLVWQRDPSVGALADWKAHFGESAGNATAMSVPEPTAYVLLAAGLLATVGYRSGFPIRRRGTDALSTESPA